MASLSFSTISQLHELLSRRASERDLESVLKVLLDHQGSIEDHGHAAYLLVDAFREQWLQSKDSQILTDFKGTFGKQKADAKSCSQRLFLQVIWGKDVVLRCRMESENAIQLLARCAKHLRDVDDFVKHVNVAMLLRHEEAIQNPTRKTSIGFASRAIDGGDDLARPILPSDLNRVLTWLPDRFEQVETSVRSFSGMLSRVSNWCEDVDGSIDVAGRPLVRSHPDSLQCFGLRLDGVGLLVHDPQKYHPTISRLRPRRAPSPMAADAFMDDPDGDAMDEMAESNISSGSEDVGELTRSPMSPRGDMANHSHEPRTLFVTNAPAANRRDTLQRRQAPVLAASDVMPIDSERPAEQSNSDETLRETRSRSSPLFSSEYDSSGSVADGAAAETPVAPAPAEGATNGLSTERALASKAEILEIWGGSKTTSDFVERVTAAEFEDRANRSEELRHVFVIQQEFPDRGRHTLQSYAELLLGYFPDRAILAKTTGPGPEWLGVGDVADRLRSPQSKPRGPDKLLGLDCIANAYPPLFLNLQRFRLLHQLVQGCRLEAKRNGAARMRLDAFDMDGSLTFDVLGLVATDHPSTQTALFAYGAIDALMGKWTRCLAGEQQWLLVDPTLMSDHDWDAFAMQGDRWDPGDKATAITLREDDIILVPPSIRVIRAVSATKCFLATGGDVWDDQSVIATLEHMLWVCQHQSVSNEPIPLHLPAILHELERRVTNGTSRFVHDSLNGEFRTEFGKLMRQFRELGCRCDGSCDELCKCLRDRRRCTRWCHPEPSCHDNEGLPTCLKC